MKVEEIQITYGFSNRLGNSRVDRAEHSYLSSNPLSEPVWVQAPPGPFNATSFTIERGWQMASSGHEMLCSMPQRQQ
jgi:hypothetical protein